MEKKQKQYYEIIGTKKIFFEDLQKTLEILKEFKFKNIFIEAGGYELKSLNEVLEISSKEIDNIYITTENPLITIYIFTNGIGIYSQSNSEFEKKIVERLSRFYRSRQNEYFTDILAYMIFGIIFILTSSFLLPYITFSSDIKSIGINIIIIFIATCIFMFTARLCMYLYDIKKLKIYSKNEQNFYLKYKELIAAIISNIITATITIYLTN